MDSVMRVMGGGGGGGGVRGLVNNLKLAEGFPLAMWCE